MGLTVLLASSSATQIRVAPLKSGGCSGDAVIKIQTISPAGHGQRFLVRGKLLGLWHGHRRLAAGLPVSCVTNNSHLLAGALYALPATITPGKGYYSSIETNKTTQWRPVKAPTRLFLLRDGLKRRVREAIHRHITPTRTADLLTGMLLGDCEDPGINREFQRLGVAHLLAVSGFHFSLLALVLGFLVRRLFPCPWAPIALIVLMSTYFLLVGASPSVQRAWLAATLGLAGPLLAREGSGLNALGAALLFVVLLDPHALYHLGFQLSFLATAAILMAYPLCDRGMGRFLRKRPLSFSLRMTFLQQHQLILLTTVRQLLALSLSVHLVTLPLLLYHFGYVPLLGLVYNLFIPPLLSVSLLLLLLGLATFNPIVHWVNSHYTSLVLHLVVDTPDSLTTPWTIAQCPPSLAIGSLTLAFLILIPATQFLRKDLPMLENTP